MRKISAFARLLRFPGIAALAIPPIIAALTVKNVEIDALTYIGLFIIGACSSIFGFVLNDIIDLEIDKKSKDLKKRPLVSGEISKISALMICITCIVVAFFTMFLIWYNETLDYLKFRAVLCLVFACILGSIYDFYGKKIVGSDIFVALGVAFVFLFGAYAVGVPNVITWIVFVLTFNNLLHMNAIEGGIKDADHDSQMGVKNMAYASGVRVKGQNIMIPSIFKFFSISIRIISSVLLFLPFVIFGYNYSFPQIIILAIGTIIMILLSIKLISIKKFERNEIRKIISAQSFLRYSLVPIMLFSIIGPIKSLILIFLPLIWYIIFSPLIGDKLFKPNM